jgi:peptide/nickel transport system substrate-binding protein
MSSSLSTAVRGSLLVLGLLTAVACARRELATPLRFGDRGGELRVLLPAEPRTLDPDSPRDEVAQVLAPNLFDGLVALDNDLRLIPDLAASWTVSPDGRTYVFHLRRGVTWHDGHRFGAGDVRWTFERLAEQPSLASTAVQRIERIDTPDPQTVAFRLREPWAPFLSVLATGGAYILPRHLAAGPRHGLPALARKPVGTGPFRLVSWVPGERITLAANRSFFRTGPFLDRVVYRFEPDSDRAVARLLADDADYMLTRVPPEQVPALARSPALRLDTSPTSARYYCALNLRRRPFADHRVREAINRAIDRQAILAEALQGYGAPGFGFYTPVVGWAYDGSAHVPAFDPERARALLDEAGLRPGADGLRFHADLVLPASPPFVAMGRLLGRQLGSVGIAVRTVEMPVDAWQDRLLGRHDFDLALVAGSQGPDPENLQNRFGSQGQLQMLGYSSPELDSALAAGAATTALETRARAYHRAQQILARDLPIAPLAEAVRIRLCRRRVRGLPYLEALGLVADGDYSLVRVRP